VIIEHSEAVENLNAMLPTAIWALIALSSSVGLGAALVFSHMIAKRLARTMATADVIAVGNLSQRIPTEGLDGVFAQQALGLNRIIDRMADMVQSQRQFASHLAHDLRTPLTRLRGLLQAYQQAEGANVTPESAACWTGPSVNAARSSRYSMRCFACPKLRRAAIPQLW
jgi:signal transduction histidine kinase